MTHIHDSGYKKLFSNKAIFRQLLESFVDEPWVKDIDFTQCETLDKSFVSDHYKETESDIFRLSHISQRLRTPLGYPTSPHVACLPGSVSP